MARKRIKGEQSIYWNMSPSRKEFHVVCTAIRERIIRLDYSRMIGPVARRFKAMSQRELKKLAASPDKTFGKGTHEKVVLLEAREMFSLPLYVDGDIEIGTGIPLDGPAQRY